MGNLGIDTFTRANASTWGNASDGQTWTQALGSSAPSIVSNKGQLTGSSGVNAMLLGTKTFYDFQLQCQLSHSNLQDKSALIARATSNNTYYDVEYTNGSLNINRSLSGSITTLASFAFSEVAGTLYQVKLLCIGFGTWTNNLFGKIWVDGTTEPSNWQVAASDSNIFGVGQFGLRGKGFANASILTYDTFSAVDPTTSLPTPTNNITKDLPQGTTVYVSAQNGSPALLASQTVTDVQGWGNGAWIRYQLPWSTIEQVSGQFLWSVLDDAVARCNIAGINLCFCLQTSPTFHLTIRASDGATVTAGTGDLPDATAMANYASVVASRYNGTTGHGIIQILQIGNEEWDTQSPRDLQSQWLVPLVNAAGPAIKAAYPSCRVAICATRKTPTAALTHITNWVTNLLTGGCGANFDIFDLHYYRGGSTAGNDPTTQDSDTPSIATEITTIRGILNSHGFPNTEIMCGETGWDCYDDGGGVSTTLSLGLIAGTAYTSIPVAALPAVIPNGTQITIDYNGTHQELVTSNGQAASGATSIPIPSFTPAFTHASGVNVYGMTTTASIVSGAQQSQYEQDMYTALAANGGGHCFIYVLNSRAVVTHPTSLPQVSSDTKSIVQTISGVYTYLPAYAMIRTLARTNQASIYYVSPIGSDSNPGTQAQPFLTIQQAANVVLPGDTVMVLPGTYSATNGNPLVTSNTNGTSLARIQFISSVPWGAKLRATAGASSWVWLQNGNYVDIIGFDVSSSDPVMRIGLNIEGSFCTEQGNYVHDIQAVGAGGAGGAGINHAFPTASTNSAYGNIVANIGSGPGITVQGIYHHHPGGNIMNNIICNCQGWGIHLFGNPQNVVASNNLCFGNLTGGIVIGGDTVPHTAAGNIVQNNILVYNLNTGPFHETGNTGVNTWQNNLVFGGITTYALQNTDVATGTIIADPKFINYTGDINGNYHLSAASPAINAGLLTNVPANDYDGAARSIKTPIDIGPYLYLAMILFPGTSRRSNVFPTIGRR